MSLHDLDKNTVNRSQPLPNTNDGVANRMAHNTTQTTYKSSGDTNSQRITMKNGMVLTYDSENRISSVYGYIPALTTEPVFIIADEGYDVFVDILGLTAPEV